MSTQTSKCNEIVRDALNCEPISFEQLEIDTIAAVAALAAILFRLQISIHNLLQVTSHSSPGEIIPPGFTQHSMASTFQICFLHLLLYCYEVKQRTGCSAEAFVTICSQVVDFAERVYEFFFYRHAWLFPWDDSWYCNCQGLPECSQGRDLGCWGQLLTWRIYRSLRGCKVSII